MFLLFLIQLNSSLFLATEQTRVFIIWIRVYSIRVYVFRLVNWNYFCTLTENWLNIIKRVIILPLNKKFTVFFCQIELGIHALTIPSSWSKQPKENIFLTQGNTTRKRLGNMETPVEIINTQLSLKKDKNIKMWVVHRRKFR